MKVSENFSRKEFACKCGNCDFATADVKLIELLESIREHFGQPVQINSACRCEAHNKAIGGSKGSKHKEGIAADIQVKDTPPNDVHEFVSNHMPNSGGIGKYTMFTHVDVRTTRARW